MRYRPACLSLVVLLTLLGHGVADTADDKKALQGKWSLIKIDKENKLEEVAKTSDDFFQMHFAGDKVTTQFPTGKEEGGYKIDASPKIKTIDFMPTTVDKGKTLLGIYSLEGDTLKLCVADADEKARPADFKAKKDRITVYVLKRAK